MRKYSIAFLSLVLLITYSCKKKDLITNFDSLTQGSYLTLTKVNNTNLDYAALNTSTVSITVGSKGAPVDKVNVYVTPEPTLDKTKWKLVKAIPFTEGVNLDIKATEIATALGIPATQLEPGSQYTLYNEVVTKDGRTFSSINTDADFEGQAGYNMALHWTITVICPFTNNISGTYNIVQDDAWGNTGTVNVVAGPGANQITIQDPFKLSNPKDIIVSVVPATGVATVARQQYGTDSGIDFFAKTSGSSNFIFSCTQTISLLLNHSDSGNDYGDYLYVLKK